MAASRRTYVHCEARIFSRSSNVRFHEFNLNVQTDIQAWPNCRYTKLIFHLILLLLLLFNSQLILSFTNFIKRPSRRLRCSVHSCYINALQHYAKCIYIDHSVMLSLSIYRDISQLGFDLFLGVARPIECYTNYNYICSTSISTWKGVQNVMRTPSCFSALCRARKYRVYYRLINEAKSGEWVASAKFLFSLKNSALRFLENVDRSEFHYIALELIARNVIFSRKKNNFLPSTICDCNYVCNLCA